MKQNLINTEADILEYRISNRNNNASGAAQIFREAQCVYNDFRTVRILNSVFIYLVQKFKQNEGVIKLTNTSKNIGATALNILNAGGFDSKDSICLMLGDFILDQLIAMNIDY